MELTSPTTLVEWHADIRDGLVRAAHEHGPIGEASQRVARYFAQHAEKEERLLFPVLALLPRVAHNNFDAQMADALPLFEKLESSMEDMLAEHRMIAAALEAMVAAAKAQDRADFGGLVARIFHYVKLEETVIYPSALVLGRYLRIRLGNPKREPG